MVMHGHVSLRSTVLLVITTIVATALVASLFQPHVPPRPCVCESLPRLPSSMPSAIDAAPQVVLDPPRRDLGCGEVDMYGSPGGTILETLRAFETMPSDKFTSHRYETLYETYLAPLRDTNFTLLEIGLGCSGVMFNGPARGYEFFKKYVPKARLVGIEFDVSCQGLLKEIAAMNSLERRRRNVVALTESDVQYIIDNWIWGDQSDLETLQRVISRYGTLDVIVDDASHIHAHMITSFEKLFVDGLSLGGVYIIEDIMFSDGGQREGAFGEYLRRLIANLHRGASDSLHQGKNGHSTTLFPVQKWIQRIDCEANICAIVKRRQPLSEGSVQRNPPRVDRKPRYIFPSGRVS